jgi:hypothetical protein
MPRRYKNVNAFLAEVDDATIEMSPAGASKVIRSKEVRTLLGDVGEETLVDGFKDNLVVALTKGSEQSDTLRAYEFDYRTNPCTTRHASRWQLEDGATAQSFDADEHQARRRFWERCMAAPVRGHIHWKEAGRSD